MKTDCELQALSRRLRAMRGPADGRGAYLGDGMPFRENTPVRAFDLADIIDELLAARQAAAPVATPPEGTA